MATPTPAGRRDERITESVARAPSEGGIDSISAVTLATSDMPRAVRFYLALGFSLHRGGESAPFTCLRAGAAHLNLTTEGADLPRSWWGRLIFHVPDVDAFHRRVLAGGLRPDFAPRDAEWRERYFHITDPDGHVLSFVHPLGASAATARHDR